MTEVLKVTHLLGVAPRVVQGNIGTGVGRTIVHKQKLPITVGLAEDALYSLSDEPLGVKEDNDHRDERFAISPAAIDSILSHRVGMVGDLQFKVCSSSLKSFSVGRGRRSSVNKQCALADSSSYS